MSSEPNAPDRSKPVARASSVVGDREKHTAELKALQMGPLWEIYRDVLTPEPHRREIPYLWPWSVVRPHLLRAGGLITAAEAERRALMLLNPGNARGIGATATLYAAAQLILPGESARAHRHSAAALRFIIEGRGAFTCVESEKIAMSPGDLVLTPSMVWHDHGNDENQPVMWLDGLDIPLADAINCIFLEEYPDEVQPRNVPAAYSEKLYGRAMFPANVPTDQSSAPAHPYSPVWAYRWVDARDALESLRQSGSPDLFDGFILRYGNPATGGEVLPSMGCRLQLIAKGEHTSAHRHTPSTVYHVAEGSGFSILDATRFNWSKGDTFAVPTWCWHEHASPLEDAVLFSFTDRPLLESLGLLRSEPYKDNDGFQESTAVFVKPFLPS